MIKSASSNFNFHKINIQIFTRQIIRKEDDLRSSLPRPMLYGTPFTTPQQHNTLTPNTIIHYIILRMEIQRIIQNFLKPQVWTIATPIHCLRISQCKMLRK